MEFQNCPSSCTKSLIRVHRTEIPIYLQKGEFYCSLDNDDWDEPIAVPVDTLKASLSISGELEFIHLLNSLRFWMVIDPLKEILDYVLSASSWSSESVRQTVSDFETDFPYLATLRFMADVTNSVNGCKLSLLDIALQLGDVQIVRLLRERGDAFSALSTHCAAKSGNLECLKCAQQDAQCVSEEAFKECIRMGNLVCLEYLQTCTKGVPVTYYACTVAAECRQFECLKYLHEHGYSLHYTTANAAVANDDLEILQYLHQHGYHCMFQGCARIAALKGYTECLFFLHEHGYPFNEDKCAWAAEGGHLHCLQFLRENGCPWDFRTCNAGMWHGHLDCLKYAYENGCPLGFIEEMLNDANAYVSLEMRQYATQILLEDEKLGGDEEDLF